MTIFAGAMCSAVISLVMLGGYFLWKETESQAKSRAEIRRLLAERHRLNMEMHRMQTEHLTWLSRRGK